MSTTDYYKILNVKKDATQDEIKKSFRSLSFKHHPDKNNGKDTHYKHITEAYNIIGDPAKRKEYDLERNMPNPEDILNMFFNGMGPPGMTHGSGFNTMFNNFHPPNFFKGGDRFNNFASLIPIKPIKHTVFISLKDIFTNKEVSTIIKRTVNNNQIIREESEEIEIPIPKDIYDLDNIILKGKGNIFNTNKGDVKIKFTIMEDDTFQLNKNDIYYYHTISLKDALCGFSFKFKYLDGKVYKINNKETIIYPNYKKKINNLGLYSKHGHGSLIIMFNINFPLEIEQSVKDKLEELL